MLRNIVLLAILIVLGSNSLKAQAFVDVSGGQFAGVSEGSSAWGDYDKDGDPDVLITGLTPSSELIAKIYRNDGFNVFTDIGASIQAVRRSAIAWGDYDNDGDPDIAICGTTSAGNIVPVITKIYRNDNGVFTDINASLFGLTAAAITWCDWDNDGDLDLAVNGSPDGSSVVVKMYRNDSSDVFTEISTNIMALGNTRMSWGDYDKDGDKDLLTCGNAGYNYFTRIYRNDGNGVFTDLNASLTGVTLGSAMWGDYDTDGDLDILLSGSLNATGSSVITKIYRNDGNNTFIDINASLPGVYLSAGVWGDFDKDGDLDIFLSGGLNQYNNPLTKIYRNNGGNSFTDIGASLTPCVWSTASAADYDDDGRLDILFTGHAGSTYVSQLYQNAYFNLDSTVLKSAYPNGIGSGSYFTTGLSFYGTMDLTGYFGPQKIANGKPTNWRALFFDATTQEFIDTTSLSGGNAYFIYHKTGKNENIFSNILGAAPISSAMFNNWVLKPGWNLVPWPYAFSADIDSRDPSKIGSVWLMNGKSGWEIATQLKPLAGYMIRNKTAGDITLGSALIWTRTAGKHQAAMIPMSVRFMAESGEYSDAFNFAGTDESATEGYDDRDELDPIVIDTGVNAYFVNTSPAGNKKLSYDVRSSTEPGHIWDLVVENATGNKTTKLYWENMGSDEKRYIALIDVTHNKRVDVSLLNEYTFYNSIETKFKVVAGEQTWVEDQINIIENSLPKEFALSQNFPNPFNPSTTIKFDVARSGYVKIKIYNILGQEIVTIADGFYETGRNYQVMWNGKDILGREAASGVYLYRLEAGNFVKTKKMLLIK